MPKLLSYPTKRKTMTWNSIMGFISTAALFLPIALILILRMGSYITVASGITCLFSIIALMTNFLMKVYNLPADVIHYWKLSNNLLDGPLMLLFYSFRTSVRQAKKVCAFLSYLLCFLSYWLYP